MGGTPEAFRRVTKAFDAILGGRRTIDATEVRRKARERAAAEWGRASSSSASSASSSDQRNERTGSRRTAEEETAEASERRWGRWRESLFDAIWRDHMPLRAKASQEARPAFVRAMERATQAFVDGGVARAESEELASRLEESERALLRLTNREVWGPGVLRRCPLGRGASRCRVRVASVRCSRSRLPT